jgi:hypothetical protein
MIREFGAGMIIGFVVPRVPTASRFSTRIFALGALLAMPLLLVHDFLWPASAGTVLNLPLSAILVCGAALLDR